MVISSAQRDIHHRWLLEVTQIPTAAGREQRVIAWVRDWVKARPELALAEDGAGNLHIQAGDRPRASGPPVYITAHMDHPAFVVERIVGPGTAQLGFRGGVMEDYFPESRVAIHAAGGRIGAEIVERLTGSEGPFPAYLAELDVEGGGLNVGDVATWELPPAVITDGLLHTHACDDLAALAAALAAYDVLLEQRRAGVPPHPGEAAYPDTRLLFTRAEEVGFIGAIAACRERTMPEESRVIALENSRSFDDSPIGGGPIVRVGDRLSVFSPGLTAAVARRAEDIAGIAQPGATQKLAEAPAWKWQRKLMAGGACEATVFCAHGYEATCLCLPLGNYHNMGNLAAVQAGGAGRAGRAGGDKSLARIAPEFISVADFDGLVDLLVACGQRLEPAPSVRARIDKLWTEKRFVLDQ